MNGSTVHFPRPSLAKTTQVKLAAYPFQKYGLLTGKVVHVSADATDVNGQGGTNTQTTDSYAYVNGVKVLQSSNTVESFEDANGTSRIETLTTYTNGVPSGTVRNVYNDDGTLFSSTPVAPNALANINNGQVTAGLNALNAFIGAIQSGRPVPLVTSGFNLVYTLGGQPPNLQGANSVISGLGSVYGLHTAFQSGGSDLARTQATLSSINYFNNTNTGLNNNLNGVPGCLMLSTTDFIASYVQGAWTSGLNSTENVSATHQTTDNQCDAMLRAAMRRGTQAPLWEVQTAKLQGDASQPDIDPINAMHSIASWVPIYWYGGIKHYQYLAGNDDLWKVAA